MTTRFVRLTAGIAAVACSPPRAATTVTTPTDDRSTCRGHHAMTGRRRRPTTM